MVGWDLRMAGLTTLKLRRSDYDDRHGVEQRICPASLIVRDRSTARCEVLAPPLIQRSPPSLALAQSAVLYVSTLR